VTDELTKKAELGAWTSIIGNTALAVMKGIVGYTSGSKALIADAIRSFSDAASSLTVLAGFHTAKLPLNKEHAKGTGKVKWITAVIVPVLLFLLGIEIAVFSVKDIIAGDIAPPGTAAIMALIASLVVKEAMFQYKYRLGKRLSSHTLFANIWERRSDLYCSVAVLTGVGGALLGSYLDNKYFYYLDPIAALFIAGLVMRKGFRMIADTMQYTSKRMLHNEDAAELLQTAQTVKGVIAVDHLKAREQGHYVIVEMKISVNPRITVLEGHDVARAVKQLLMKRYTHVSDVYVHVNPYDPGYPYKNNVNPEHDDFSSLLH